MNTRRLPFLTLALALLAACGGEGEVNTPPPADLAPGDSDTVTTAALSWEAPPYNSDGSPTADLAGYRVYHGTRSDALNEVIQVAGGTSRSYSIKLPSGMHFFAVAAYTTQGLEGPKSAIRSKFVP